MATASRPGGIYYIGDVAVDANGVAIEGAPERPKDTDASLQPGSLQAPTPEERMGHAIAAALRGQPLGGTAARVITPVEQNPAAAAAMPSPLPAGTQISDGANQPVRVPAGSPIPGSDADSRERAAEAQKADAEAQTHASATRRK